MSTQQSIGYFCERWIEEFARSVEMSTGEKPTLTQIPIDASKRAPLEGQTANRLWWKQTVGVEEGFAIWVGADQACWSTLGGARSDASDPKQMYLDMVTQANQDTAAAVSANFPTPLRCREGAVEALPDLASLALAEIKVTFRGNVLPSLILALDPAAERILAGPAGGGETAVDHKLRDLRQPNSDSPMLSRLMELHLPVSVLLGRATLSIREILKISPGSLIELDRHLGDYVEVTIYGSVVARGEIVSVKGNYGVRIKEIMSKQDRLALQDAA